MTALAAGRTTKRRDGRRVSDPVAAGAVLFVGGLYALDASGNAVPAGVVGASHARAIVLASVDNTGGGAGALRVEGECTVGQFANSAAGDAIARADIGRLCFAVDDQTVAKTDNSGARAAAGVIVDVDAQGVWVDVQPSHAALAAVRATLAAAIAAID